MAVAAPRCLPAQGGRLARPLAVAAASQWSCVADCPGSGRPAGSTCGCLEPGSRSYKFNRGEEEAPSQGCHRVTSVGLADARSHRNRGQDTAAVSPRALTFLCALTSLRTSPAATVCFLSLWPCVSGHVTATRACEAGPLSGAARSPLCSLLSPRSVRRADSPNRSPGAFQAVATEAAVRVAHGNVRTTRTRQRHPWGGSGPR